LTGKGIAQQREKYSTGKGKRESVRLVDKKKVERAAAGFGGQKWGDYFVVGG